jgi:hypothetical protein
MDDVLAKMTVLGAGDLVVSRHIIPPAAFSTEQTIASTDTTIREICRRARQRRITVHLRVYPNKAWNGRDQAPPYLADALETVKRIGAANLRLAPSVAQLAAADPTALNLADQSRERIGLWMAAEPAVDMNGRLWSVHQPIAGSEKPDRLARIIAIAPGAPIVFDVLYENGDAEYRDAAFMETLLPLAPTGRKEKP